MASNSKAFGFVLLLLVGLLAIRSEAQSTVVCDYQNNLAPAGLCTTLVNSLQGNNTLVPRGQQSVCDFSPFLILGARPECCVSWSAPAPGVTYDDLYNSAAESLAQCQSNNEVSALQNGVSLAGTIVTQCLSSRSDGC